MGSILSSYYIRCRLIYYRLITMFDCNRKFIWCTFHLFTILLTHIIWSYKWQVFTSLFHMYFGGKFYEEKKFWNLRSQYKHTLTFGHEIRGKSCGIFALDYGNDYCKWPRNQFVKAPLLSTFIKDYRIVKSCLRHMYTNNSNNTITG